MNNWTIQKNAVAPVPKRGRRRKWAIPLDKMEPGDMLTLDMGPAEARNKANAVRSFISREQKKTGIKYSVYVTDAGISIFRRSEDE